MRKCCQKITKVHINNHGRDTKRLCLRPIRESFTHMWTSSTVGEVPQLFAYTWCPCNEGTLLCYLRYRFTIIYRRPVTFDSNAINRFDAPVGIWNPKWGRPVAR